MADTDRHIDPTNLNGWLSDFHHTRSSDPNRFVNDLPQRSYYAPRIMSEPRGVPRSNTSWATSATPDQDDDIFDRDDEVSFYSMSTAPSLNGPQHQRLDLPIPPFAPAPPVSRLVCEFVGYGNCDVTFEVGDEEAWIEHIAHYHLHDIFPAQCICWFCDRAEYRATSNSIADLEDCYRRRMYHIAGHLRQGLGADQMRPDHYFLSHLNQWGLISEEQFHHARNFHEMPQIENLHPAGWRPSTEERGVVQEERRRPHQSRHRHRHEHGHGHRHESSRSSGHRR